ncbi:MAG: DapH/DapD/GlmU-related protein [Hornefia sp.]|nr:DapH/DapD/GlmU-related protein [Hornefia sp.]
MTFEEYKKKEEARITRAIEFLNAGVEFADINSAYIDEDVKIGKGTFIGPCVTLEEGTVIGDNCRILQNTRIKASEIGNGVEVQSSVILESKIGDNTSVGPFAYIRPGSEVGKNCKVGDFVELKNAVLGDGSKSAHLTYIGDADIGKDTNLGCGVVFVNYDGTSKYRSEVGDGVFIGCNANIVSPIKIEKGAYIAAGSTVTRNVPEDALCVARSKQRNIEGWATKRGLYNKK